MSHELSATLWEMPGEAAWVFVTLPLELSTAIRAQPRQPRPGFGSLRVVAAIGATTWKTSIFPDSKSGCYVLPVKKAVRSSERIAVGDTVAVTLEVLE